MPFGFSRPSICMQFRKQIAVAAKAKSAIGPQHRFRIQILPLLGAFCSLYLLKCRTERCGIAHKEGSSAVQREVSDALLSSP